MARAAKSGGGSPPTDTPDAPRAAAKPRSRAKPAADPAKAETAAPKRARRPAVPAEPAPLPELPALQPKAAGAPPEPPRKGFSFLLDRVAVLFIGIAVGVTIGLAFASHMLGSGVQPQANQPLAASGGPNGQAGPAPICGDQTPQNAAAPCAQPFTPRLLTTLAKGQPVTIGVFGDSFGEGIWAALYWTLPKSQNYQVIKFAERSTGFTRYQSLNLEDKAASDIAGQPIDIAVISFGANDTQGIVDGGHVYALLTPGWKKAYGARVARYVALLRREGAMVYWVGLPKMRSPDFDSQIVAMNDFYASQMAALDVPFFPTEALSVDGRGQFNIYLFDAKENKQVLMRANDGIHMSIPGYERITAPLVDRIKAYVAHIRQQLPAPPPTTAAQAAQSSGRGT